MKSLDFMYDGQYLSDYGFSIGYVTTSGRSVTVSPGAEIEFEKISRNRGRDYSLVSANYSGSYTTTFEIFKNPEIYGDALDITDDEARDLIRWLNRREFLPFCLLTNEDETEKFYNASFNVARIKVDERVIGLQLTMETDAAVGYGAEITNKYTVSQTDTVFVLSDMSDEVGYLYPDVSILVQRAGTLQIVNQTFGETTEIKNCVMGETIKMYGNTMMIETDDINHAKTIAQDFNFNFLKIGNTINNRQNRLTFSLPCVATIKYKPIIK